MAVFLCLLQRQSAALVYKGFLLCSLATAECRMPCTCIVYGSWPKFLISSLLWRNRFSQVSGRLLLVAAPMV
ncbi:hypothetical protein RSK20926_10324 [Roseobacter sp. SK209-2-6]|nr:hypothetical protein RSK20926_10324 [Roseobacter sp. SK209-2-6]